MMKLAKPLKQLKHTGKKEAGINVQIRFVPLKLKEKELETDLISVAMDKNH